MNSRASEASASSLDLARTVADAVLYEGYLLYPYRATSRKNQIRWQFGVLGPPAAAAAGIGEAPDLAAQCLVSRGDGATVTVHLRFLQLQVRAVERLDPDSATGFTPVEELVADGTTWLSWEEAVEHEVVLGPFELAELAMPRSAPVRIDGGEEEELLRDRTGARVGRTMRRRWPLLGELRLTADPLDDAADFLRLRVAVTNTATEVSTKDEAIRSSFIGAHLLLVADRAEFVSLLDPPEAARAAAANCAQHRCFPVLAGPQDEQGIMLVSPIILYDHPEVAEQSAGALYDSTEIDEILTLRVMTMTEEEKAAARATDPRAAEIIDRCDALSAEELQAMHGVLRDPHAHLGAQLPTFGESIPELGDIPTFSDDRPTFGPSMSALDDIPILHDDRSPAGDSMSAVGDIPTFHDGAPTAGEGGPWWDPGVDASVSPDADIVLVDGVAVSRGSIVRLHPKRRADAQDLFFAGQTARVTGVFFDVDGAVHVAVVLTDDPAADLHDESGRYLYFAPDEIEPDEIEPDEIEPDQIEATIDVQDTSPSRKEN